MNFLCYRHNELHFWTHVANVHIQEHYFLVLRHWSNLIGQFIHDRHGRVTLSVIVNTQKRTKKLSAKHYTENYRLSNTNTYLSLNIKSCYRISYFVMNMFCSILNTFNKIWNIRNAESQQTPKRCFSREEGLTIQRSKRQMKNTGPQNTKQKTNDSAARNNMFPWI